jgi:hypothetical protein
MDRKGLKKDPFFMFSRILAGPSMILSPFGDKLIPVS